MYHHVTMQVPRDVQAGAVVSLTEACRDQALDCGDIDVLMNLVNTRPPGDGPSTAGCVPARTNGGSVRIIARTARRVTGTFTLQADCAVFSVQEWFQHTLSDGSFDLPIVQPGDYPPVTP